MKVPLFWPRGADGLHRRTLLEVALSEGNFKMEMVAANNDDLNDPSVIRKALSRASEYMHGPLNVEVDLREKWRIEDEVLEAESSPGDVPMVIR